MINKIWGVYRCVECCNATYLGVFQQISLEVSGND